MIYDCFLPKIILIYRGEDENHFKLYHKLLHYFNIIFEESQVFYGKNLQNLESCGKIIK